MFTFQEIKAANTALGHHYFKRSTMRFFRSRLCGRPYPDAAGGAHFVTSEQAPSGPRRYTVRYCKPNGDCGTAAGFKFQEYSDRRTALHAAYAASRRITDAD